MTKKRYQPTPEEKRIVQRLSGLKVPTDVLRLAFINPKTNKPFSKKHFFTLFADELKHGAFRLKALIANGWYNALEQQQPWAIKIGLRNNFGLALEGGNTPMPVEDFSSFASDDTIKIRFVFPDKPEPVDITPAPQPNPYAGQPASDAPALEPPRSTTVDTGYPGLGPWRTDPDPKGWMR
jgi:hypothetical protein